MFASPLVQPAIFPGLSPCPASPLPLQYYYRCSIPNTPRTHASTTRAMEAGGLFTQLHPEAQEILVTLMKQLLQENKRAAHPRLSILKNLVAMENSHIDFLIDLYSMARTGKLGTDIAECANTTFTMASQPPLLSKMIRGATDRQCNTRRTENAAACPRDSKRWNNEPKASGNKPSSLYVFNLPNGVTDDAVRGFFANYGEIAEVQFGYREQEAHATVLFNDAFQANVCAFELKNGFLWEGNHIIVVKDWAGYQ